MPFSEGIESYCATTSNLILNVHTSTTNIETMSRITKSIKLLVQ